MPANGYDIGDDATPAMEMRCFDLLPKNIRTALNNCNCNVSAVSVYHLYEDGAKERNLIYTINAQQE